MEKKYVGPLVHWDRSKCINCGRCKSFSKLIAGDYSIGEIGRSIYDTYKKGVFCNELSGNLADICPTAAFLPMVLYLLIY